MSRIPDPESRGANTMFYVSPEETDYLRDLGRDNRSAGLRVAIQDSKELRAARDTPSAAGLALMQSQIKLLSSLGCALAELTTQIDNATVHAQNELAKANASLLKKEQTDAETAIAKQERDKRVAAMQLEYANRIFKSQIPTSDYYLEQKALYPQLEAEYAADREERKAARSKRAAERYAAVFAPSKLVDTGRAQSVAPASDWDDSTSE